MTNRPTRDETLMIVAATFAKRSTCSRASVGVVIARDGRILVTGYNGSPAGMPHCDHTCNCGGVYTLPGEPGGHDADCPAGPCKMAVHAEANAIAYAAKHGVRLEGSVMYTTYTPCVPCAQLIINAGITEVFAANAYRDMSGLNLLTMAGIMVH